MSGLTDSFFLSLLANREFFFSSLHCFRSESKSGRPIEFIALPLLDGPQLFADDPQYQSSADVRCMVSHLNGHARGLAFLREILTTTSILSYDAMFGELNSRFVQLSLDHIPKELIVDCLLGRPVKLTEKVTSTSPTYMQFVEQVQIEF